MDSLTGFVVFLIVCLVFGYLCHVFANRKINKAKAVIESREARGKPLPEDVVKYMLGGAGFIAVTCATISFISLIIALSCLAFWFFP